MRFHRTRLTDELMAWGLFLVPFLIVGLLILLFP